MTNELYEVLTIEDAIARLGENEGIEATEALDPVESLDSVGAICTAWRLS